MQSTVPSSSPSHATSSATGFSTPHPQAHAVRWIGLALAQFARSARDAIRSLFVLSTAFILPATVSSDQQPRSRLWSCPSPGTGADPASLWCSLAPHSDTLVLLVLLCNLAYHIAPRHVQALTTRHPNRGFSILRFSVRWPGRAPSPGASDGSAYPAPVVLQQRLSLCFHRDWTPTLAPVRIHLAHKHRVFVTTTACSGEAGIATGMGTPAAAGQNYDEEEGYDDTYMAMDMNDVDAGGDDDISGDTPVPDLILQADSIDLLPQDDTRAEVAATANAVVQPGLEMPAKSHTIGLGDSDYSLSHDSSCSSRRGCISRLAPERPARPRTSWRRSLRLVLCLFTFLTALDTATRPLQAPQYNIAENIAAHKQGQDPAIYYQQLDIVDRLTAALDLYAAVPEQILAPEHLWNGKDSGGSAVGHDWGGEGDSHHNNKIDDDPIDSHWGLLDDFYYHTEAICKHLTFLVMPSPLRMADTDLQRYQDATALCASVSLAYYATDTALRDMAMAVLYSWMAHGLQLCGEVAARVLHELDFEAETEAKTSHTWISTRMSIPTHTQQDIIGNDERQTPCPVAGDCRRDSEPRDAAAHANSTAPSVLQVLHGYLKPPRSLTTLALDKVSLAADASSSMRALLEQADHLGDMARRVADRDGGSAADVDGVSHSANRKGNGRAGSLEDDGRGGRAFRWLWLSRRRWVWGWIQRDAADRQGAAARQLAAEEQLHQHLAYLHAATAPLKDYVARLDRAILIFASVQRQVDALAQELSDLSIGRGWVRELKPLGDIGETGDRDRGNGGDGDGDGERARERRKQSGIAHAHMYMPHAVTVARRLDEVAARMRGIQEVVWAWGHRWAGEMTGSDTEVEKAEQ